MVLNTELYDILEVSPSATDVEIKNSYKKLALKYHPDKSTGKEEDFKKVKEAYEILSDPNKRRMYDLTGNVSNNDLMNMYPVQRRKAPAIVNNWSITLENLYNSKTIVKEVAIEILCKCCDGQGAKNEYIKRCKDCNGQGYISTVRQIAPGMVQSVNMGCKKCNTTGISFDINNRCKECDGNGFKVEMKKFEIELNHQFQNGQKLCFQEQGNEKRDCISGDVIFTLNIEPNDNIIRNKDNSILMKLKISLVTALTGGTLSFMYLNNRKYSLNFPSGKIVQQGQKLLIPELGFQRNNKTHADLIIELHILMPTSINSDNLFKIKNLLPSPPPEENSSDSVNLNYFPYFENKNSTNDDDDIDNSNNNESEGDPRFSCNQQ